MCVSLLYIKQGGYESSNANKGHTRRHAFTGFLMATMMSRNQALWFTRNAITLKGYQHENTMLVRNV